LRDINNVGLFFQNLIHKIELVQARVFNGNFTSGSMDGVGCAIQLHYKETQLEVFF